MFHVNWWTLAKISNNIINKENKNALLRSSNNNFYQYSNKANQTILLLVRKVTSGDLALFARNNNHLYW